MNRNHLQQTQDQERGKPRPPIDPLAKALFALISATCIGVGLMAVVTGHAPARSTRFGMAGALAGDAAMVIGVITILFGMMRLGIFAKTAPKAA